MNEMKLQVKSLFRASSQAYGFPDHPNKADLKLMGKFITGNPLIRIEILFDFWQMDYDELYSLFYNHRVSKSGEAQESFPNVGIYQSEIEQILLDIEFDVINDFKKWEIQGEDRQKTISEIQRLQNNVEKWQYVKGISDNENFVSNRIMKTLRERIDNNYIKPLFRFTFTSDEEIINIKKKLKEYTNNEEDRKMLFPYILTHKDPIKLAGICKKIFNSKYSPKVYAIMFCLLSDKGYIVVPNRGRKYFYTTWYYYIDRPLPKNSNFSSINKFIVDKAINGLIFSDESDPDFLNLKEVFYKELINNKL